MVTCKLTGGMANLLFITAATLAYAAKHKIPYAIPTATTNKRWKHYRFPGVLYEDANTSGYHHYKEPAIFYEQRPYNIRVQDIPVHENIVLEGHFLSHKYFWEYKDIIFDMFGFSVGKFGYASIHQRRGDYLRMQQYLPCMDVDYFSRAIQWVIENTGIRRFMVFSDDLLWCREHINTINFPQCKEIVYSDGDEIKDLEMMASCRVNILANSTYSLWAHYLNKHDDKIAICPNNWYGPAYGEVDKTDLYPPNAIVL